MLTSGTFLSCRFSYDNLSTSLALLSDARRAFEPCHEKTNNLHMRNKRHRSASFAVTAKLISAFVFATQIVQFLYFLNPKFQASGHLLCLYSSVCVGFLMMTGVLRTINMPLARRANWSQNLLASEFSTGPTILSRSKLFWIQRSAHCKTKIAQTNYDDFRLNSNCWP